MARKSRNEAAVVNKQTGILKIEPSPGNDKIYRTALYARLSREDSGKNDPMVIENQICLLKDYVKNCPSLNIVSIFIDNGCTGTNFERPGFCNMMAAVREQKIDCILLKDLSRLGRNFIETGEYIEKIFPLLGVRLIAVSEGVDTLTIPQSGGLDISFKNLLNEVYAKDTSRKVSSALAIKMQEGDVGGGIAPYGYRKYGRRFVIDPDAAETVRQIFKLRAEGKSYHAIARALNEAGILSPSAYRYEKGLVHHEKFRDALWKRHVLTDMLSNRVYLGELRRGKTKSSIYKGERLHQVLPEQQKVHPNAHEAIIDEVLFQKVRETTAARKNEYLSSLGKNDCFGKEKNLFGKKLICADCGAVLTMHKCVLRKKDVYYYYNCPVYVENRNLACCIKSISKEQLEETVLEIIKLHVSLFLTKKNRIQKRNQGSFAKANKKTMEIKLREINRQVTRNETYFEKLYIDYKEGLLTESEYLCEKEKLLNERIPLKEETASIEKRLKALSKEYGSNFETVKIMEKNFSPEKLTGEMVSCFIEKISVHTEGRMEAVLRYQDELVYPDDPVRLEKPADFDDSAYLNTINI